MNQMKLPLPHVEQAKKKPGSLNDVLHLIKPKVSRESDKFSWNLWRFVNKHKKQRDFGVFFSRISAANGAKIDFSEENATDLQLYVLGKQDMCGNRLRDIMGTYENEAVKIFAFVLEKNCEFVDVTEWFIGEFLKKGRCMFDKGHCGWWSGEAGRFTKINKNSRRCNWCGKHLRRKVTTEKIIRRQVKWGVE